MLWQPPHFFYPSKGSKCNAMVHPKTSAVRCAIFTQVTHDEFAILGACGFIPTKAPKRGGDHLSTNLTIHFPVGTVGAGSVSKFGSRTAYYFLHGCKKDSFLDFRTRKAAALVDSKETDLKTRKLRYKASTGLPPSCLLNNYLFTVPPNLFYFSRLRTSLCLSNLRWSLALSSIRKLS